MTGQEIADQTLRTIETGLERGRHVMDSWVLSAPRKRNRVLKGGLDRLPLWIGAGLLGSVALLLLNRRRQPVATDGSGRRRLQDVMVTDVHTIAPDATVMEVAEQMRQKNVGVLPIVDGGRVVGVITDRDLVIRVLAKPGLDLAAVRVMDCATKTPIVAKVDWTAERALLVMAQQQIGRLPVIDERGQLAGMVTLSSLALRSRKPDETLAAAKAVALRSARADAA